MRNLENSHLKHPCFPPQIANLCSLLIFSSFSLPRRFVALPSLQPRLGALSVCPHSKLCLRFLYIVTAFSCIFSSSSTRLQISWGQGLRLVHLSTDSNSARNRLWLHKCLLNEWINEWMNAWLQTEKTHWEWLSPRYKDKIISFPLSHPCALRAFLPMKRPKEIRAKWCFYLDWKQLFPSRLLSYLCGGTEPNHAPHLCIIRQGLKTFVFQ